MEGVHKKRRQQRMTTLVVVVALIVIVVGVAIFYPRTTNAVPLPGYLDRCLSGSLLYHSHPHLVITINGANFAIPSNIGIQSGCLRPIHTHNSEGIVHTETEPSHDTDFTLRDFFLIWGNSVNNPTFAIFNSTQIFNNRNDGVRSVNMTVTINGNPVSNPPFQNYVIPRNAGTSTEQCTPGPCAVVEITITYGLQAS